MTRLGRIIIADDEGTFLESTADLLREEGYECDCAMTGQNAIEWLGKKKYDLLIADIKMPGNCQMELIKELPKIAEGLMAILVTGYPSLETATLATRLPVAGYLIKPVNFDDLLELVHQSVARTQAFRLFNKEAKSQYQLPEKLESANVLKHFFPAWSIKAAKDLSRNEIAGLPMPRPRRCTRQKANQRLNLKAIIHSSKIFRQRAKPCIMSWILSRRRQLQIVMY
jgi:YesN/AraC family two-component response regulator